VTYSSASAGCSHTSGVVTCAVGNLAAGAATTRQIVVIVDPATRGSLTNSAVVAATEADPMPGNNSSASLNTPVTSRANLMLSKTDHKDIWYAGWNYEYTIVVTNTGPSLSRGTWLTDTLPEGVGVVMAPVGATHNRAGSYIWDLGDLAVGESRTLTLLVRTLSTMRGVVTNIIEAASAGGGPFTASDSTTIIAAPMPVPTATATTTLTPTATPSATPTPTATPTVAPHRLWLPNVGR
jgi:uncharacterized repeat protein (TIGR01451 family)